MLDPKKTDSSNSVSDFKSIVKDAKPFGIKSVPAGTVSFSGVIQKSPDPNIFVLAHDARNPMEAA